RGGRDVSDGRLRRGDRAGGTAAGGTAAGGTAARGTAGLRVVHGIDDRRRLGRLNVGDVAGGGGHCRGRDAGDRLGDRGGRARRRNAVPVAVAPVAPAALACLARAAFP